MDKAIEVLEGEKGDYHGVKAVHAEETLVVLFVKL